MEENLNNEVQNNYEPQKNNNGVRALLIIIAILLVLVLGLLSYKIFVYDRKNGTKSDDNKVNETAHENIIYEIKDENNIKYLYVNNKKIEQIASKESFNVEEFKDLLIVKLKTIGAQNYKIYSVNDNGEVTDLNVPDDAAKGIYYHHTYELDNKENKIKIIANPGSELSQFNEHFCSIKLTYDYYKLSTNDVLNSKSYIIGYEYLGNGNLGNKMVLEEKTIAEEYNIENCKSKEVFIDFIEGYICTTYNDKLTCFNDTKVNKEKLENLFGKENCSSNRCIISGESLYDSVEAHIDSNNFVTEFIYNGISCTSQGLCQQIY